MSNGAGGTNPSISTAGAAPHGSITVPRLPAPHLDLGVPGQFIEVGQPVCHVILRHAIKDGRLRQVRQRAGWLGSM